MPTSEGSEKGARMYASKDRLRCVVVLQGWRVEGDVHVIAGSRLTDAMNAKSNEFIAVTDAVVFDINSGAELYRPPYIALNRGLVSAIFPAD
jgi:hypothetical protein